MYLNLIYLAVVIFVQEYQTKIAAIDKFTNQLHSSLALVVKYLWKPVADPGLFRGDEYRVCVCGRGVENPERGSMDYFPGNTH